MQVQLDLDENQTAGLAKVLFFHLFQSTKCDLLVDHKLYRWL